MALTAEELAHEDTLTPGARRFVAEVDGALVGVGVASIFYAAEPEFEGSWTTLQVHAFHRRRGIGAALLPRMAEHASTLGKRSLHMWASEARPEALQWLARRGFVEHERSKHVALPLAGLDVPAAAPPHGIELTTLRGTAPDRGADLRGGARGRGRRPVRRSVRGRSDRAVADVRVSTGPTSRTRPASSRCTVTRSSAGRTCPYPRLARAWASIR